MCLDLIKLHSITMRLFLISLFFVLPTFAAPGNPGSPGTFGVRLTVGGAAYVGGVENTSNRTAADQAVVTIDGKRSVSDYTKYIGAGWSVPLQLEGTYRITDAFEVLWGLRYGFTGSVLNGEDYIMKSLGTALGYRYYFNAQQDPIQAYLSGQLAIDLTQFTHLEAKSAFGFLYDITDLVGVFLEGNFAVAALYNSDDNIGKGLHLGGGLATGVQFHF